MKDLTKGNSMKLIFAFAMPVLLGNIFQLLYNLIDTKIVGETLGSVSLAAVGATNSVNSLIVGFLLGLTNGFAIIVARYFGAKDMQNMRKAVAGTLMLGVFTSILITMLSVIFLIPLLKLLNTPENILMESYDYISIIFMGMTVSMLYNICASVLRAIGDTLTPLVFLIFSTILNIFLDYMLILNCHIGVKGAAYATIISQSVSVIMCFIYIWYRYPMFHLKKEDFKISLNLVKHMYSCGFSMGFMMSLVSLGTVALQSSINTFGTNIIVAHTAARKLTELFMLIFSVLGTTMATFCGQNLGAGEIERIKDAIKKVIIATWVWCIGVVIISYTIVPHMIRFITGTNESEIINTASLYLRIDTIFYFVTAVICILRNCMQGIGDHTTPLISSSIELIGKVAIVVFLAPRIGYMGIILSEPIVWFLMVIPLIVKIRTNPVLNNEEKLCA